MNALMQRQGWQAHLELDYQYRAEKTRLVRSKREGPLAVQRAFYPEGDVCHTYLLHPPGGVVAGDSLNIDLQVAAEARVLITTPGATKFYRSMGLTGTVVQKLQVSSGASLEWMPLENIFFPGTKSQITTEVELAEGAMFIGWEINCLGRPSNDERFESGELSSQMKIYRNGEPLLFDRFATDAESAVNCAVGLRGVSGYASMVATLDNEEALEAVQQLLAGNTLAGVTVVDGLMVVRVISDQAHQVVSLFANVWKIIRPYVSGRDAVPPRIWAT